MDDIVTLYKSYKSAIEKEAFVQIQLKSIQQLKDKNQKLEEELSFLKQTIVSNVQPIVISPEEELIDSQISVINQKSIGNELTLEDVKKLDLLLKNKLLLGKNNPKTIETQSKKLATSNAELLEIAKSNDPV